MFNTIGKFTNYMPEDKAANLSEVKADVLWYLLNLTNVNRFFKYYSFQEFLTRYFFITDQNLDKSAYDFIEEGILIAGFIGDEYFEFTLNDLIQCIGFSSSNSKFNVSNSRREFIESFKYRAPNIKINQNENPNKPTEITTDTLSFALIGLKHLLAIDSFTIKFRTEIKSITLEEIVKIENYVSFIMKQLPEGIFLDEIEEYKTDLKWMEEFYDSTKEIYFNVKQNLSKETIAKIYEISYSSDMADYYLDSDTDDEDTHAEFERLYEHIKFAYGVKHGYITLSSDPFMDNDVNPYFKIDSELFMDDDCTCFSTKTIFENWWMEDWINLLP